jgi:hypothetical protein
MARGNLYSISLLILLAFYLILCLQEKLNLGNDLRKLKIEIIFQSFLDLTKYQKI